MGRERKMLVTEGNDGDWQVASKKRFSIRRRQNVPRENSRSWLKDTFPPGWGWARSRKKEMHEGEKTKKVMEDVRVERNSDEKRK